MMSNDEANEKIAAERYPRVTKELMNERIKSVKYMVLPDTTVTICNIMLDNGYSVRGESACVDKRNFNLEIGEKLAYEDAYRKLWPLFGFVLAENNFRNSMNR